MTSKRSIILWVVVGLVATVMKPECWPFNRTATPRPPSAPGANRH